MLKKEYKSHLKRNAIPLATASGIFAVFMIFIIFLFSNGLLLKERHYKTVSSSSYEYVVESSTLNLNSNIYYKMQQLVTCESVDGRVINVNVYMDLQDVNYDGSPLKTKELADNEIAISKKVAEKLKLRIEEALNGVKYDETRLLNEVAFYADKVNIDEELTRLNSHINQFKKIVVIEGAGKKLDFLMQEFNRETNTICSKSNDITVTGYALSLKNEIEKVREQVQNLE